MMKKRGWATIFEETRKVHIKFFLSARRKTILAFQNTRVTFDVQVLIDSPWNREWF